MADCNSAACGPGGGAVLSASAPTLVDFVNAQPFDRFGVLRADLIAFATAVTEIRRIAALPPGNATMVLAAVPATLENPSGILNFEIVHDSFDPAIEAVEIATKGGIAILSAIGGGMPTNPFYKLLLGLTIPAAGSAR